MAFLEVRDQMNRIVILNAIPKRIISLVPSQTELLYDLGMDAEVIGITKFCIHPEDWFRSKTRIGGTKTVDIEKVKSLKPDLIIGNKEENSESDIIELMKIAPVWMSDIVDIPSALEMIEKVGEITGKFVESKKLVDQINRKVSLLQAKKSSLNGKSCLYFIWKDPFMTAGKDTFIDSAIALCGLKNAQTESRYPEWNFESEIIPDFIFLSSEPFPFKEEHVAWFQTKYPSATVKIVDGEMFSWYGSRMLLALDYFEGLGMEQ